MFRIGLTQRKVRVTAGSQYDGLRLQIEDESSSTMIVELKLDRETIWELLRGGSFELTANMPEDFSRVGKTMLNDQFVVPPEVLKGRAYNEQETIAEQWAQAEYPDWDSYSARRRGGSGGVAVVVRKWVDQ